jgi:hypothetical protein
MRCSVTIVALLCLCFNYTRALPGLQCSPKLTSKAYQNAIRLSGLLVHILKLQKIADSANGTRDFGTQVSRIFCCQTGIEVEARRDTIYPPIMYTTWPTSRATKSLGRVSSFSSRQYFRKN